MNLRIHFITPVNEDCRYIKLQDIETGNYVSYRIGWKHEYIISKMNGENKIKRAKLLIRLITIAFAKKFNIENPYKEFERVFSLGSLFYGR